MVGERKAGAFVGACMGNVRRETTSCDEAQEVEVAAAANTAAVEVAEAACAWP
jgi:hypothetical protein